MACSCTVPGTPTEELEIRDVVFVGVVRVIDEDSFRRDVVLQVDGYWKGANASPIVVSTCANSGCCGVDFVVGRSYIVYGNTKGGVTVTSLCTRTRPLELASEDLKELGPPSPVTPPAVEDEGTLAQNYPNPFNPRTTIHYTITSGGQATIAVYDPSGRVVRVLVDEFKPAGEYSVEWDGMGQHGATASSGVYLYALKVHGKTVSTKRMILIK